MSWTADASGNVEHQCDRCGATPSEANPFGTWSVVLVPRENAKHFCGECLEPLKVMLDEVMSGG
jgi:hypothetical protein